MFVGVPPNISVITSTPAPSETDVIALWIEDEDRIATCDELFGDQAGFRIDADLSRGRAN